MASSKTREKEPFVCPDFELRKLSEKTLELNLCSQIASLLSLNSQNANSVFWFGLTQTQERDWGFDACARIGQGRMIILQFKSAVKTGFPDLRRFHAPHEQMVDLINRSKEFENSVFYVLPEVMNFADLRGGDFDLLSSTWLLNVNHLPDPMPTSGRKSGMHNIEINSNRKGQDIITVQGERCLEYFKNVPQNFTKEIIINSDPIKLYTINAKDFFNKLLPPNNFREEILLNSRRIFPDNNHGIKICKGMNSLPILEIISKKLSFPAVAFVYGISDEQCDTSKNYNMR